MSAAVNPLSSATNPFEALSTNPSANKASTETDASSSLANENTFLQLLVAQIKSQDPTQPMDSSTFLTQLAEFSQLEQLIGIRQGVSQLDSASGTATANSNNTPATQN